VKITGKVVDTGGHAVTTPWLVQIYRADDYPNTVAYSTTTSSSGTFTFPAVDAPQNYVIVARQTAGSAEADSQAFAVTTSGEPAPITLTVSPS